jgi:hypothetical protein
VAAQTVRWKKQRLAGGRLDGVALDAHGAEEAD